MGLIEKRYTITGWKNEKYEFTANELCERVLSDSVSNYNWIAPASELVKVVKDAEFPVEYAQKIKIAILNCFANLALNSICGSRRKTSDMDAVYFCYNSIKKLDKDAAVARETYLKAIILSVIKWKGDEERLSLHPGARYRILCDEWVGEKFAEYVSKEEIDFYKLKETLHADFDMRIKKAEDEGAFVEDDKKFLEEIEHTMDRFFA